MGFGGRRTRTVDLRVVPSSVLPLDQPPNPSLSLRRGYLLLTRCLRLSGARADRIPAARDGARPRRYLFMSMNRRIRRRPAGASAPSLSYETATLDPCTASAGAGLARLPIPTYRRIRYDRGWRSSLPYERRLSDPSTPPALSRLKPRRHPRSATWGQSAICAAVATTWPRGGRTLPAGW